MIVLIADALYSIFKYVSILPVCNVTPWAEILPHYILCLLFSINGLVCNLVCVYALMWAGSSHSD